MDPTYVVRAVPANEYDCNLCAKLAESAVHCAFAGFTNFSVGMINNKPCMIPLEKMCGKFERKVEPSSDDYLMLLASTGQPSFYPQDEHDKNNKKDNENKINDEGSPVPSNGGYDEIRFYRLRKNGKRNNRRVSGVGRI